MKKWQIDEYHVIKTSHFGIIFIAHSIKYGKCVLKIIPPFIGRYEQERSCYCSLNASFMCELLDFDDSCSALLMEYCYEVSEPDCGLIVAFFDKVVHGAVNKYSDIDTSNFHDYSDILHHKLKENSFDYKNEKIIDYVKKAVKLYDDTFNEQDRVLIHGDLHSYNIMSKDNQLVAIDPIGYIAPAEIDIARFIGTELTDGNGDIAENYNLLIEKFSVIADRDRLKKACFIDMIFRLHNSLFENENYDLTDKWLNVLNQIA